MIQKQKGFSAPVLALSVWTAALAEEMQTGISPVSYTHLTLPTT